MMSASARSHAGRVRPQNEDAAVCRPEHGLFAVIDGMGGQEAGEVAAAIAAAALAEVPNLPHIASETALSAAMKEARKRILAQAEKDTSQRDMGAVATAVRLEDNGRAFAYAHVGDTRAWLVTAKGVRLLTRDHVADVESSPGKRPVTRDLGRRDMPGEWVDTGRVVVARNDLLVLASDGLHDAVPADELAAELQRLWREGADADAVTARLVALALARGGPDNVTVVAVRVGRFRRGQSRRLPMPVAVGLLVVMAGLAGVALFGRRPPPVSMLPDRVSVETAFSAPAPLTVEAGKTTTVAAGTRLSVRGVRVGGVDWRIEVGEGATVVLELVAADLSGAFTVVLADGATLELRDTRVTAPSVRFVTAPGSHLRFAHALLEADAEPSVEGPGTVEGAYTLGGAAAVKPPAPPSVPDEATPPEGGPAPAAPAGDKR